MSSTFAPSPRSDGSHKDLPSWQVECVGHFWQLMRAVDSGDLDKINSKYQLTCDCVEALQKEDFRARNEDRDAFIRHFSVLVDSTVLRDSISRITNLMYDFV